MSEIKAILFDMDGVLVDAKEWHYQALNRALMPFGMTINHDEHRTTYDGLPTRTKLKILSESRGLPADLHELINELKQKYTLETAYAQCRPSFSHRYALSQLALEGYRLAVCSNSVRRSVDVMMELSGLSDFLEVQLSNEDVSSPKPDPEMYIEAMERLGVRPDECLVVEDNENGIRAAHASGAHVMEIENVDEVTYDGIKNSVSQFEGARP